jgi:serine/threonine protein kinase
VNSVPYARGGWDDRPFGRLTNYTAQLFFADGDAMPPPVEPVDSAAREDSSSSDREILGDLGEYRLLKRLGTGGMGHVYKAMHRRLEKLVAVKTLPSYRACDPRALARFDREIKALGRLNHPNIVQAFDAQEIEGTRFLVMEYVDGIDLSALVRRCGALRIADACELTRQAALGLQAAHEHGLVHRDVKPSNLILSRGGDLKVLDLGLARFRAEPLEAGEMTAINETIGTAEYIAPEQVADSHQVDIRADIYSLGCTLFRLLTGQPPFAGPLYRTAVEKMVAHMKEEVPCIRQVREEVSESLASVIERMVAKDPDRRFSTPRQVADALAPHAIQSDLLELVRQADAAVREYPAPDSSFDTSARQLVEGLSSVKSDVADPPQPGKTGDDPTPKPGLISGVPARAWAVAAFMLGLMFLIAGPADRFGLFRAGRPPLASAEAPAVSESGTALARGVWIEVLAITDVDRDRVSNLWERRGNGIGSRGAAGGYPRIMLPVMVEGDYDLEVAFTRNSGRGAIVIVAPVGGGHVIDFILSGNSGDVHGFNSYYGHDLQDPRNLTAKRPGTLDNGRRYTFSIQIRGSGDRATIDAALDGKPLVHCAAPLAALPTWTQTACAEPQRPALGVQSGDDATFHCARVRIVSGSAGLKPPRATEPCPPARWIDLLSRIDLPRDHVSGEARREGNDLVVSGGSADAALMLPVAVRGSYQLEVEFTHSPASGIVSFILPVGLRRVRVNPNRVGEVLPAPYWMNVPGMTDGDDAQGGPRGSLEAKSSYLMSVKVTAEKDMSAIELFVDGKRWISWTGKPSDLHDGPILLPEPDRIGLAAAGTLTIQSARLRLESGKALLLVNEPNGQ